MVKAKLVIVGGDAKKAEVPLKKLPATIGRASDATITLPHSLVSRFHCEISHQNNHLMVKDMDSLNGTYINNEKIDGSSELLPGQLLTLGNVTFRAVYDWDNSHPPNHPSKDDYSQTEELQKDDTVDFGVAAAVASHWPQDLKKDTDHGCPEVADPKIASTKHDFPRIIDDELAAPDRSIACEALKELPENLPMASFAGGIEIGDNQQPNKVYDCIKLNLDLGEKSEPAADNTDDDSSLNDFFRKFPK